MLVLGSLVVGFLTGFAANFPFFLFFITLLTVAAAVWAYFTRGHQIRVRQERKLPPEAK